jgi:23S rRNA (cytidine2498-2'-O)-methyltransferase
LVDLPVSDRATPIAAAIGAAGQPVSELFLEVPDREDTKVLAPLCRALERPVMAQLQRTATWDARSAWRAHVCFTASTEALVGIARLDNSAPWPGGVPRLKFPRAAPSRSTLKLEEAFLTFLGARDRDALLRPGLRAVDLGAAPGGWTWQFVQRHIHVTAVDNGAMDAQLMESGLVEHVRADGFRYQPGKPVDWMVCDIVEQPIRVARLAGQWFAQGWCRRAIFNLKLPMKKRYAEVRRCLEETESMAARAGRRARLRCKQLYHDREEVTVYLEPQ